MQQPPLSPSQTTESKLSASAAVHGIFSSSWSSPQHSPVVSNIIPPIPSPFPLPLDSASHQVESRPGHLHPIHVIHFSNDVRLVLKTSPPQWTPLLRHEGAQLATEATVLKLLARSSLPVPKLVRYEPLDPHVGPSILLTGHLSGVSYAAIRQDMMASERASIERQIRSLNDVITQYTSPTFGPVKTVADRQGYETWEAAFATMIEDVLMDGEDILVALPFNEIRHLMKRMGWLFREVQEARLVVQGLGEEKNVLVDRQANEVTGVVGLGSTFWGDGEWAERKGDRGIFYTIYDAIVTIVTNHYRPRSDNRELDARKVLTQSLAQLTAQLD